MTECIADLAGVCERLDAVNTTLQLLTGYVFGFYVVGGALLLMIWFFRLFSKVSNGF